MAEYISFQKYFIRFKGAGIFAFYCCVTLNKKSHPFLCICFQWGKILSFKENNFLLFLSTLCITLRSNHHSVNGKILSKKNSV